MTERWLQQSVLSAMRNKINSRPKKPKFIQPKTSLIPSSYQMIVVHIAKYIHMLEPLKSLWNGHLRHITTNTFIVEQDPLAERPMNSFPYRYKRKIKVSQNIYINNIPSLKIINSAQAEWASPILWCYKKDGIIQFFNDNRIFHAVTFQYWYHISRIDEYIDSFQTHKYFLYQKRTAATDG